MNLATLAVAGQVAWKQLTYIRHLKDVDLHIIAS